MHLQCNTNNNAQTVLEAFLEAVSNHGLPSRVRGDQGVENVDIAQFMFNHLERSPDRGSFISRKRVHNQRIERLWVDVYVCCVYTFYCLFNFDTLILMIFCLHYVFTPRINSCLQKFIRRWDSHPIEGTGKSTLDQEFV